MIYNLEDGRKALRDVFALQLFDNVQVGAVSTPCACVPCRLRAAIDACIVVEVHTLTRLAP